MERGPFRVLNTQLSDVFLFVALLMEADARRFEARKRAHVAKKTTRPIAFSIASQLADSRSQVSDLRSPCFHWQKPRSVLIHVAESWWVDRSERLPRSERLCATVLEGFRGLLGMPPGIPGPNGALFYPWPSKVSG